MKANELRIGNWVWNEPQQIPVQVDIKILQEQLNADKGFGESWQPIPITEEMLLKFGFVFGMKFQDFVRGKYCYVEILGCNFYGYFSENGVFYFNSKTEIKHIHQLQNLYFALTGEELGINL